MGLKLFDASMMRKCTRKSKATVSASCKGDMYLTAGTLALLGININFPSHAPNRPMKGKSYSS